MVKKTSENFGGTDGCGGHTYIYWSNMHVVHGHPYYIYTFDNTHTVAVCVGRSFRSLHLPKYGIPVRFMYSRSWDDGFSCRPIRFNEHRYQGVSGRTTRATGLFWISMLWFFNDISTPVRCSGVTAYVYMIYDTYSAYVSLLRITVYECSGGSRG